MLKQIIFFLQCSLIVSSFSLINHNGRTLNFKLFAKKPTAEVTSISNNDPSLEPKAKKSSSTKINDNHKIVDKDARSEALSGVLHQIERSYGKGSIQKLGETPSMNVATTSSGSMTLDLALGEKKILFTPSKSIKSIKTTTNKQ
jgi:hypothetical protein